ncbi:TIGR03503 family protein [Shewanella avicenniae]|uniref:TIGR03503 family protein n=1 Tax=Shewanella avicenniae TaxID=2814294 RepID=A0ABX7QXT7_9GAMM|nr:TIGR03503 family protein [Shewanella avicenniae]
MAVQADTVPAAQASELKNRFRIDHMVDEVTLVIQREFGSAPVVIIQPDGSKWYSSRHPQEVKWTDSETGDFINIKKPTPGPWQLTGKIVKGSKILLLSKLAIDVESIPQPVYQGERLKLRASMLGDDLKLRLPGLSYMMQWSAKFSSRQNKEDENFAAGTISVGSYQDNGTALDERPDDGEFTSNFNLEQPWGHYTLIVQAQNEVFRREYQEEFFLSPMPADIEVIEPEKPTEQPWQISIVADANELKLDQSFFELTVIGPAGFQANFSEKLNGVAKKALTLTDVTEYGSYRIKGELFATTKTGREIVITLPERFFNYVEPPAPPPSAEEMAERAAAAARVQEEEAKSSVLTLIIVGNVVLILLAAVILLFLRKRQSLKLALAAAAKEAESKAESKDGEVRDIDLTMPDEELR